MSRKVCWPVLCGAAIEYYDMALYGFMAPILVPLFMPSFSAFWGYVVYFFIDFLSACSQYLGARYFGRMGDTQGRVKPLYYTVLGISSVTALMCVLPTYAHIGLWATLFFACIRMGQNFFYGGEFNGGAIYCIEHGDNQRRGGWISGLYGASVIMGSILASVIVLSIYHWNDIFSYKWAYGLSFFMAIGTYYSRRVLYETPHYQAYVQAQKNRPPDPVLVSLKKTLCWPMIIVMCCFGLLYGIPTRIFNIIIPQMIDISTETMLLLNSLFLVFYLISLLYFAKISDRIGVRTLMRRAILTLLWVSFPLIWGLQQPGEVAIVFLLLTKTLLTGITAAFIAPIHAWIQTLFSVENRYFGASTASALGKCLSTLLLALSVVFFQYTHSLLVFGLFLSISALCAFISLRVPAEKKAAPC